MDKHRFTQFDEKITAVAKTFDGPIKRKYDTLVLDMWEENETAPYGPPNILFGL